MTCFRPLAAAVVLAALPAAGLAQVDRAAEEAAVKARRDASNAAIARRDAAAFRSTFDAEVKIIGSNGGLILGAEAMTRAMSERFAEADFIGYVRATDKVTLDDTGLKAAETGRWTGDWTDRRLGGDYLAIWRKTAQGWVLEAETYVLLSQGPRP